MDITENEFAEWTDTELAFARPTLLHPADARQLIDEITRRQSIGSWNPEARR